LTSPATRSRGSSQGSVASTGGSEFRHIFIRSQRRKEDEEEKGMPLGRRALLLVGRQFEREKRGVLERFSGLFELHKDCKGCSVRGFSDRLAIAIQGASVILGETLKWEKGSGEKSPVRKKT